MKPVHKFLLHQGSLCHFNVNLRRSLHASRSQDASTTVFSGNDENMKGKKADYNEDGRYEFDENDDDDFDEDDYESEFDTRSSVKGYKPNQHNE